MINIKIKNDTLFTIEKGIESIDYPRNFYAQKVDGSSFEIIHFESKKKFLIAIWYLVNVQIEGITYTDISEAVSALNAIVYNSSSGGTGSNPVGYKVQGDDVNCDQIVSIGDVNDQCGGAKVTIDSGQDKVILTGYENIELEGRAVSRGWGMDFEQGADIVMKRQTGFPPFTNNFETNQQAGYLFMDASGPFGSYNSIRITPENISLEYQNDFSSGSAAFYFPVIPNQSITEVLLTREGLNRGNLLINPDFVGNDSDPSAIFEIQSTEKGLLIPRMTTSERDLIVNPVDGLLVYNITTKTIDFRKGNVWHSLGNKIEKGGIATNTAITVSGTGYTVLNDGTNTIQYTIQKTGLADIEFNCSRSNNTSNQLVFIRIERNGIVIKYSSYNSFNGERHAGQVGIQKVGVNAGDIIRISTNGSTTSGTAQHTIHNANLMVTVNPIETIL